MHADDNSTPHPSDDAQRDIADLRSTPAGLVHSYQKYDPKEFPSPTAPPPDLAGMAMEHMLAMGDMRELTEEELARAIRLDPSMFPRLGPSIASLRAMLEQRKRRILEKYETGAAQRAAAQAFAQAAREATPPKELRQAFERAVREEQVGDFERLYYKLRDDQSDFAVQLTALIDALGNQYQIDELASRHAFTGREAMDVPTALAVKQELDTIDALLEQLKEAEKNAQLAIIDMESLEQFADSQEAREQIQSLNELQRQIEDYVRNEAERQGLEKAGRGFRLSPKALRLFQRHLLTQIFSDLQAARSGRHAVGVEGEGVVEMEKTRPYEFGDGASHLDIVGTVLNAAVRQSRLGTPGPLRASLDDAQVHRTRNNPRCASAVIMDMSGSMRYDGQYIQCKRMALALDGLIRGEYPGDYLAFIEMYSLAKLRRASDIPALLPKPVSIHSPRVRLKADMSNPRLTEAQLPQHFTNIQHALRIARQVLGAQDTPNRQILLITDGLPTAHFEGSELLFLYPPDPRTEAATMREAALCQRAGITINIFLLPSWSQTSEDVQFAHRLAETTSGRVFFTAGKDLDRYVVWDYVAQRRRIIG